MRVKWTRKALINLNDAVNFIANDKPGAAGTVAQRIWDAGQMIGDQPGMGRPGRVAGIRELILHDLPFILPFREKDGVVYILRVIHTSMKWPDKLFSTAASAG